ncbi:trehalose-phosphatase [Corynebacterium pseudotuberculosis]|uniref:Trehalose 6-phosphate phosphatase n=1 Tax=Corynebacterium pseudotuberculosis 258 TaxID=1168865 RepID=A0AAU8Q7M3_CORPS|nr:trehalose-phosphatase [Corynebacterium pseudotuberculosis]AEQ07286.1 trehalose-phosphatase [Corynebacterium pseudotuberculosis CIP 52.97]AFH91548.1 trehalose-phosphatase [Corynebacterium pseudotuberculosis 31]AFK17395.1 trehalose-phosphatase [Corynebacterium pseudotuberculosis 258]AFM08054.2 trehalose-phosphatase [Corynebacterium pseudotuberculosis Cp162]AKS14105.1 Trehalose-6-phosphate phosphatase [Corynebacterium pseudotuberculosis]
MTPELSRLARAPRLLVVSDFDGTLAGFSTDAQAVPIEHRSLEALRRLAACPHTEVAVLSGRGLAELRQVSGLTDPIVLIGSHGAESSTGAPPLTEQQHTALTAVTTAYEAIAQRVEGAFVEYKPFHRVLHVIRVADHDIARSALDQALAVDIPGVTPKEGKWIVEAGVIETNKGTWISQQRTRADATVFLGDDTTDEDAFRVLGPTDLGVKVGPGITAATHRVDDLQGVADLLTQLADLRS